MQLRLGVEGEAEVPDVVATLGVEDRREVVAALAGLMMKAAVAAASEEGDDSGEGNQEDAGGCCKIAWRFGPVPGSGRIT
ncbi:MAG: hypothetical protein ACRDX8_07610 [Acidimicrobiales bacterium]